MCFVSLTLKIEQNNYFLNMYIQLMNNIFKHKMPDNENSIQHFHKIFKGKYKYKIKILEKDYKIIVPKLINV